MAESTLCHLLKPPCSKRLDREVTRLQAMQHHGVIHRLLWLLHKYYRCLWGTHQEVSILHSVETWLPCSFAIQNLVSTNLDVIEMTCFLKKDKTKGGNKIESCTFQSSPCQERGNIPWLPLTVVLIIGHCIKRGMVERHGIRKLKKNAEGHLLT